MLFTYYLANSSQDSIELSMEGLAKYVKTYLVFRLVSFRIKQRFAIYYLANSSQVSIELVVEGVVKYVKNIHRFSFSLNGEGTVRDSHM